MSALTRQLAAMTRLLVDSGDITPMGKRQIERVLAQHAGDDRILQNLPTMTTDDVRRAEANRIALPGTDKENN